MSAKYVITFAITALLLIIVEAKSKNEFPSYIKICKRTDPNVAGCLKENAEIIRPHLKQGIKKMKIPGIDPLFLPSITLSLPNFNATFKNINIYDATNYVINDLSIDIDKLVLKMAMTIPSLTMFSDYEINGKLLVLELSGHGKSTANISDLTGVAEMSGALYEKNDKPYLNFTDHKLKLEIGNARVNFDNLFGRNKELTETTNTVINENIKEFIVELQPLFEQTVTSFIVTIVKQVFKMYSMDELFPK